MESGLYESLCEEGLLISHKEVSVIPFQHDSAYKVIQPEKIAFVSYPYEWSFSQLKDAALLTLRVQQVALEHGMTLKDATAYNIQFHHGKPIFIDTLSFEKYQEGKPWSAYRQFAQHFLAPLALMCHKDISLSQLFRIYIDGIPLKLASTLLPLRTYFIPSIFMHIHMHAKAITRFSDTKQKNTRRTGQLSRFAFLGLIDNLESAVKKFKWANQSTEWGEYYDNSNYSTGAFEKKCQLVTKYIEHISPSSVWDMGANTGVFSRIASKMKIPTISFDSDPLAVEKSYLEVKRTSDPYILPLNLDINNPSPGIGWQNRERTSLIDRGPTDVVLALALIHHLAIGNNVPFFKLAEFFASLSAYLIIEFVPKSDVQVQRLLRSREDVFVNYNQDSFVEVFGRYFEIMMVSPIEGTQRTLYLLKTRK